MQVVVGRAGRGEVSGRALFIYSSEKEEGVKWPLHFSLSLSLSLSPDSSPFSLYTENIVVDVSQYLYLLVPQLVHLASLPTKMPTSIDLDLMATRDLQNQPSPTSRTHFPKFEIAVHWKWVPRMRFLLCPTLLSRYLLISVINAQRSRR